MLDFITINPSDHRKFDFDIKGLDCSRWQVDFYNVNPDHLDNPEEETHIIGSLHFTAYNLKNETSSNAYKALQRQLGYIIAVATESHTICGIPPTPFSMTHFKYMSCGLVDPFRFITSSYTDILDGNMKSVIAYYQMLLGKTLNFNMSNIGDLSGMAYQYYSALKWLVYPFTEDTNTRCLKSLKDFRRLLKGKVELKDYLQHSIY